MRLQRHTTAAAIYGLIYMDFWYVNYIDVVVNRASYNKTIHRQKIHDAFRANQILGKGHGGKMYIMDKHIGVSTR